MTESLDAHRESRPPESREGDTRLDDVVEYDLRENIGFLLRTTNQVAVSRFNRYVAHVLEIENLTTTQFAVLTTIHRFPGTSFSALSDFTSIDMPTLASMITRLSRRGLVQVKVNPRDKRSRSAYLSPEGEELADHLTEHGNRIGEFISTGLSENELKRLKTLLKKMCAGL
ncbi:MarR family transcriptional regulator [Microbaculum marinisediminis]|uniref:MarR family transcriptional regulator n=1 Tax=Microbaculum marinisediminis TaxID=2931392 RepID=A0AAW5R1P9_9HYPH|nr:MarR family transcriptional regulator [Microbaculum sp. A6E488]MCT8973749.1 MarR family transcriptional regulator [Microbaculum sp. A6E488]